MKIKSKLFLSEKVKNTSPKINSDAEYFCAYLVLEDGSVKPALFTDFDIKKAITRAEKNPEDMPKQHISWFNKIFG